MNSILRKVSIYLNGMREFRTDVTTSYDEWDDVNTYDAGRDMAHRLTLRRFDQASA